MALTLISTHTASASATLDITSGIDSTYDSYEFHMVNMHPASEPVDFHFQVNAAGQTGFNETITSSYFEAYHNETDSGAALRYNGGANDQAQGTAYQVVARTNGNDNDQNVSAVLRLYDPSSPTYVKHFSIEANSMTHDNYLLHQFVGGYINTTAAIDEISFKFSSGNIDAGTIKMFGVS